MSVGSRTSLRSPPAAPAAGRLTPYVPRLLIRRLAERPGALAEELEGTVVFVDVSGFTQLSERLTRRGRVGAEELAESIGACFTGLLALASANGGSLLKFGGDALLLFFGGEDHAARACRAAIWMRRTLRDIGKLQTSAGRATLRMSVGIHSGRYQFFLVGGSHRELLIAGPAVSRTVLMEHTARAGEILVSHATAAQVPDAVLGAEKGEGRLLRRVSSGPIAEAEEPEATVDPAVLLDCVPLAIREHLLSTAHDPEHRQATVAFLRFDGTDELIRALGVHAVGEALDELIRDVQSAVDARELCFLGSDVDQDGGKIILTAGVPRAFGNDEERMLLALRDIASRDRALPVRVGVNRGAVFAGDIGPPYRRTYTIMGDTVNLAARLMAAASPGAVLATEPVLDGSRTTFSVRPLEPFFVKGKAQAVKAFSVGEAEGARGQVAGVRAPLVGRASELAAMRAALERTRKGEGRLLDIVGEPGIGKSRLIEELCEEAHDVALLSMTCELYGASTPYMPFRRLLERLFGIDGDTNEEVALDRLREVVATNAPGLGPWVPLLAVPLDLHAPPTPETMALDDRFRRRRLEEAMTGLLAALLPDPCVLTVEDAHWMDEASSDLLRYVAGSLSDRAWLICVARRAAGVGFQAPESGPVVTLRPPPLEPHEAEALLEAATESDPIPSNQIRALASRSGGNPLLAYELLAAARAAGGVEGIPESVEALMTSRIDRLSPSDRTLLRRASVLGSSFAPSLVEELLDAELTRPTEEDWGRLAEFIEIGADRTLSFRSALVRDVAYEGLPYRLRRELHARAGDALERAAADPAEEAELLSLHFFHARRHESAWRYSRLAGDRARGKFAPAEAAEFYRRALEVARGNAAVPAETVAEVSEALGDAHDRAGEYAKAAIAYRSARALVSGDPVREAGLLLKQAWIAEREGRYVQAIRWIKKGLRALEALEGAQADGQRAQLAVWYAAVRQVQGRYSQAVAWCRRAIEHAERSGDRDALAHAYFILDWAYVQLGRVNDAVYSPRALEIYEELGDLASQAVVYNNLGAFAYWAGRWDEAIELYERGRDARERVGDPVYAAMGTLNVGEILSDQGRLDEAERCFRRALRVWRAAGDPHGIAYATTFLGRLASREGRFDEAMALLREARGIFADMGADGEVLETDGLIAECLVLQRRANEALDVATAALVRDEESGGLGTQTPLLQRVRGCALMQLGDMAGAREALDVSLQVARGRGAQFEVAQTLTSLSALERLEGRPSEPARDAEIAELLSGLGVEGLPGVPAAAATALGDGAAAADIDFRASGPS